MKALVAGGAGFIGSHLCDALLEKGYEVICVDNLLTGSKKNVAHLEGNDHFQFIDHDVRNPIPDLVSADFVYHLASPASPNHHSKKSYHSLPFETMLVNTRGTMKLADFALQNHAKFLFASTSEVYGDPLEHPQKEEYRGNVSTTGPRSIYDESKRFGETITAAFVRSKNLDGRIIRIFNTFGPRMAEDDGRAVIEFLTRALGNDLLPIFGDGKQTRSFCYISDLVEGIIKAMEIDGTINEVINLGNPNECTILDLANRIKELTGSNSEIVFAEPVPKDDPQQRSPDITKAKQMLHWEPKISLEEGLKKLIESLKHRS